MPANCQDRFRKSANAKKATSLDWEAVYVAICTTSNKNVMVSVGCPTSYLMPFSLSQVSTLRQKGEMLGTVGVLENCSSNEILNAIQQLGIHVLLVTTP